jgi:hypothetical protein
MNFIRINSMSSEKSEAAVDATATSTPKNEAAADALSPEKAKRICIICEGPLTENN